MIPTEILVASIAAVASCLVALINVIYSRLDKRERKEYDAKLEEYRQLRDEKQERDARERDARGRRIDDTLIELKHQSDALTDGVCLMLRSELVGLHREYSAQGYMTLEQSEYLESTHTAYQELHGNHLGDKLYHDLIKLPIREEE